RRPGEEGRSAPAAEDLLEALLGHPGPKLLRAGDHPHAARLRAGVRGGRRAGASLAAGAMTVGSRDERLRHLEADGAAAATSRDERAHRQSLIEPEPQSSQ